MDAAGVESNYREPGERRSVSGETIIPNGTEVYAKCDLKMA